MSINDKFVLEVFNSMVKHRPKLALLLDDDDDDDDFDIRELSNSICKSFPWPIGVELRRLLSGNMEVLNRGRIDQIFKTIERTMQYLSFILVVDLLENTINNGVGVPDSFKKQFRMRFTTLTLGNYIWLIRSIIGVMKDASIDPFVNEINSVFTKKLLNLFESWTKDRNEISHYLVNLSDEEIEVRCNEYLEKLGVVLSESSFLIKYPLVTVSDIHLTKPKHHEVSYQHSLLVLNSASSTFHGKSVESHQYTDSHSVLLVKSLKNAPNEFLNLSPLIIDTHFEIMESREKLMKLKKDIYLYSKWNIKSEVLSYVGTEVTEKADMKLFTYYNQLVEEYKEIMEVFSTE